LVFWEKSELQLQGSSVLIAIFGSPQRAKKRTTEQYAARFPFSDRGKT